MIPHPTTLSEGNAGPPALALAFAPLHKRALGIAVGTASGLTFFALTAFYLIREPAEPIRLDLLAQYFYGYTVTWRGAFVSAVWGFGVGFVAGWFLAFCRNLALAISIFVVRSRAELSATRDFLDHV